MEFSLAGEGGRTYAVRTEEVRGFDPELVKTILEIDLMTFSERTWSRTTARLLLQQGKTYLLKADDLVIGTCHFVRSWDRSHEAVLVSMAIRPGWRGRGLGTRFLQGVLDGLRHDGIRSVVLEVDSHNKAGIAVYEGKFGFHPIASYAVAGRPDRRKLHMRLVMQPAPLAEVAAFPST